MGDKVSAATIAAALGKTCRSGTWWRCRCPVHASRGSTLALRDGKWGLIVKCWAGCDPRDIRTELCRLGLIGDPNLENQHPLNSTELERQRAAQEYRDCHSRAAALDIWNNGTVDPGGSVTERYWASRGLSRLLIPPTIRASRSRLRHPEGGSRPAMIALVEHVDLGPVAIHRTFLAIDGSSKANYVAPRLSLAPTGGAAVHLADVNDTLVVAEGIETAASVMLATGFPAWAAISAVGLQLLVLPPVPIASNVVIAADHDRNGVGIRAAHTAAKRWYAEGRHVRIALPPASGTDWNDVLLNKDIDLKEACNAAA